LPGRRSPTAAEAAPGRTVTRRPPALSHRHSEERGEGVVQGRFTPSFTRSDQCG
jgi:hypothetical protein